MKLAMIGLGKMGAKLVRRLVRDGHQPVVYHVSTQAAVELAAEMDGIQAADSLSTALQALEKPRAFGLMMSQSSISLLRRQSTEFDARRLWWGSDQTGRLSQ